MANEMNQIPEDERTERLYEAWLVLTLPEEKLKGHETAEREIIDSYIEERECKVGEIR